ncbi:MAG: reverse transcriptase/maturase family protein [Patescibacteria group bacterium]
MEDNLFQLHEELRNRTYTHHSYHAFYVRDPKLRHIHKAVVRDRVVHQAIFRVLYPVFDRSFIFDSYSCRMHKGTHRGVTRLEQFLRKVSKNYAAHCFALKCDVRKFFDSIDHNILLELIDRKVDDDGARWLIRRIIKSFEKSDDKGLPLGNVTSQLFANIYLNELDQFVKHTLKEKHYVRYCDDFIIVSHDKSHLKRLVSPLTDFLRDSLLLALHPQKIFLRKYSQGIDFLGYVILPHYRIVRTRTRRRILKKIRESKLEIVRGALTKDSFEQSVQSYFGVLGHCKGFKVKKAIEALINADFKLE